MNERIKQGFEYQSDELWRWWIWVEGTDAELDQIDHVVYILHPTFTNPVRTTSNRDDKFRLEAYGRGTFTIYAKVVRKNRTEINLSHDLVLEYPDGSRNPA